MERDFTKVYITEAFRLYARLGCPSYERAREIAYEKELEKRRLAPPDLAIAQAEKPWSGKRPCFLTCWLWKAHFHFWTREKRAILLRQ